MAKAKILLVGEIEHPAARQLWEDLAEYAELVETKAGDRDGFVKECEAGELDGVVALFRTFNSVEITGRFDEQLISILPKSLRFICHNGAGYDQIDIPPCTAAGIQVSNVPTAPDDSTADTAVFLILGCLRNFNPTLRSLRDGSWRGSPPAQVGHNPEGKTLGIVGMGGIGRNLAKKMRPFGMRIIYFNRRRLKEEEEKAVGAEYVGFEELLTRSDVVSLNLPLNPTTRHLISGPQLALMKRGAILVNTARGAIVDEAALVEALGSGHLASAGLDVFEREPCVSAGLLGMERVLLLPHMGTWTEETQEGMEKWCLANVREAVTAGRLRTRVPEQQDGGAWDCNGSAG